MSNKINKLDLVSINSIQRKECLENEIAKIPDINGIESDLQKGKKFEILLKQGFPVRTLIANKSFNDGDIKEIFSDFEDKFMGGISKNLSNPKPSIYTISETPLLAKANTFSRELSTKLGSIWEEVAFLSPKIISMEKLFDNYKIRGVDIIIDESLEEKFSFCQIKTMHGTLTGSQKPRSEQELKIYEHSKFVAALNLGNWTFNSNIVQRVSGKQFWDLIDIEYQLLIEYLKKMMSSMERYLTK